jgi:hypothetical protein
MFVPQYEGPSFTPKQNKRQHYRSVYSGLHIFYNKLQNNILRHMIASIPYFHFSLNPYPASVENMVSF